jgi:hypothetical protein
MWIGIFLYIFYTIICSFLIQKNTIVRASGLSTKVVVGLFIIKLLGGLCYHYIHAVRFYGGDSHALFSETVAYLHTDRAYFWHYFFKGWSVFKTNENVFSVTNAISWSNLGNQINYRFLTICNVFSLETEVVNYIFYNAIFFIGEMALLQVFAKIYPHRATLILIFIFFTPSIWFWCSGVHKDGFVISFIGLLLYYTMRWMDTKKRKYLLQSIFFLIATITIRYYLAIVLVPFYFYYLLSLYYPTKSFMIHAIGVSFFLLFFFNINTITSINPPNIICIKQTEFMHLNGSSYISNPKLQPTAFSFLENLPFAINHCLMRPYIWEAKDGMYLLSAIEILLLFITLLFLIFGIRKAALHQPLFLFCICFSFFMFVIIGYIVPFSGAFIRYRSEYLAFLFSVCIGSSQWALLQKIEEFLKRKLFKN